MSVARPWYDPIVRRVAVATGVELLRVRAERWTGITSLVRALALEGHPPFVTTRVESLRELPHGAVVVYLPREAELEALNLLRSWLSTRALRLVLWTTAELRAPLQRSARDVLDWVIETADVDETVPRFWQANLRAAIRAGARGFRWEADCDVEPLIRSVVAAPRVRTVDVSGMSFAAMSAALTADREEWLVVRGLRGPNDLATKRFRWAAAHTARRRIVLDHVQDPSAIDGWWTLQTSQFDPLEFEQERADETERQHQRELLLRAAFVEFERAQVDAWTRAPVAELMASVDPLPKFIAPLVDDPWNDLATVGWSAGTRSSVNTPHWIEARHQCVARARKATGDPAGATEVRRALVECNAAFELVDGFSRNQAQPADVQLELFLAAGRLFDATEYEIRALARAAGDPAIAREFGAQLRTERWASGRLDMSPKELLETCVERLEDALDAGRLEDAVAVLVYADELERTASLHSPSLELLRVEAHLRRGDWSKATSAAVRARELLPSIEPVSNDNDDRWFAVAAAAPARRRVALELELALLENGGWSPEQSAAFEHLCSQLGSSIQQDINLSMEPLRLVAMRQLLDEDLHGALDTALRFVGWADDFASARDARQAMFLAAWCQRELGMLDDARQMLRRVLDHEEVTHNAYHPDKLRAFVELARVDRADGRYKRSRAQLRKALRRYPTALPESAPELLAAVVESATLTLVEAPVTGESLATAERALAALTASLSPLHWEVRRADNEIAAARRRLAR